MFGNECIKVSEGQNAAQHYLLTTDVCRLR